MKVGIEIRCKTCGYQKKPHGRSSPAGVVYCNLFDCRGYEEEPKPGCLWPGESEEDFGYGVCDNAITTK